MSTEKYDHAGDVGHMGQSSDLGSAIDLLWVPGLVI